jgi:demethylmenaquinone methyltransferase/2-methoxy-6-polyprenyl-1,4-benzoquinol methylase
MREPASLVPLFFSGTGATYDRVVRCTTLGFDARWKARIIRGIPHDSSAIIDQACGTGILTTRIARSFPRARVVGVDMTEGYLEIARKKVRRLGLENVELLAGRAEDVMPEGKWDCITSSYLAKYADLHRLVGVARSLLRPGGVLLMHDFTRPPGRVCVRLWRVYLGMLKTVGPCWYPEWKAAFDGLPALLYRTSWVPQLAALLRAHGFREIETEFFTLGTSAIVAARRLA